MTRCLRRVFVIIILGSLFQMASGSSSSAQSEEETRTEFSGSVEVRLGTITVVVRDKKNQPISGLMPSDFVLFVNGVQREITNFAEVSDGTAILKTEVPAIQPGRPLESAEETVATTPQPRLLAVVVDTDNISIFNRNHLIKRAQQFIENSVQPPNLGMVVTNERYPKVHCPPTTNSEEMVAALEGLFDTVSGTGFNQNAIRFAEDHIYDVKYGGGGRSRVEGAMGLARMTARQVDGNLQRSVETLKTICRALGGFEGKKDVLYVSDGLPMIPGDELFRLMEILFNYREAMTERNHLFRGPLFEELTNQAIAADVTIHTVDARGLMTENDTPAERRREMPFNIGHVKSSNYQEPLRYISAQTGGIAIVNTNEFEKRLQQVEGAITRYYSLGFRLGPPGGDRLYEIKVVLPDLSGIRALYRKQFLERSAISLASDRTMAGLLVDPSNNTLGIDVTIDRVVHKDKEVWIAEALVEIPLEILAATSGPGGSFAEIALFAVASSENGRSPMSRTGHFLALPEDGRKVLPLQINLALGPGHNRISIGVLHKESGLDGFAVVETNLAD